MYMETVYKEILDLCKSEIESFEIRLDLAFDVIGHYRCPLEFADSALFNQILDLVDEYCDENEIDPDSVDIEEMIWKC